jgi:5'-3' exonuclease
MGIKDFAKVFINEEKIKKIKIEELKNKVVAIDTSIIIMAALNNKMNLSGPDGAPTFHLKTVLDNIIGMMNNKVLGIWVLDPKKHILSKSAVQSKRVEQTKERNAIKLKGLVEQEKKMQEEITDIKELAIGEDEKKILDDIDKKYKHLKDSKNMYQDILDGNLNIFKFAKTDILRLFNGLNIPYIISPDGVEAEQTCAYLNRKGKCDYVYSKDTDAIMFGASTVIYKPPKSLKFWVVDRLALLNENKIDQKQIVKAGICLGCDFAPKVPGVGPKTVLGKLDSIEFTDEQKKAEELYHNGNLTKEVIKQINSECKKIAISYARHREKKNEYPAIREWLKTNKGFGEKMLTKLDKLFKFD